MDNDHPDFIAAIDQAARAASDVARLMRAYYVALIEEGFDEHQAFGLLLAYQQQVLS